MRDPARISLILKELETLWRRHPDQRLGQLLENYVFDDVLERGEFTARFFYKEDDTTLASIRRHLATEETDLR